MSQICDHDVKTLMLFLPSNIFQLGSGEQTFVVITQKRETDQNPFQILWQDHQPGRRATENKRVSDDVQLHS